MFSPACHQADQPIITGHEVHNGFHYTVDDWCWEIPAGGVKPDQSPEEAALAELREETGGRPETLAYVQQFYTANGICNEIGDIFLATGVELGLPQHEPVEVIEIYLLPTAEVLNMAHTGKITDATSALAILLCESQLRELAGEEPSECVLRTSPSS